MPKTRKPKTPRVIKRKSLPVKSVMGMTPQRMGMKRFQKLTDADLQRLEEKERFLIITDKRKPVAVVMPFYNYVGLSAALGMQRRRIQQLLNEVRTDYDYAAQT